MRTFLAALLLALCVALPARAESVLYWKLQELNGWVRDHSEYKSLELPKVVFRSYEELGRMYYGDQYRPDLPLKIEAITDGGVIFLEAHWKPVRDDYVLLHELVHFQQFESGKDFQCVGQKELEAYTLQDQWVVEHGRGKRPDKFTVFVISQCYPQ